MTDKYAPYAYIESTNNLLREVPHILRAFHKEAIYRSREVEFNPMLDAYAKMEENGATFAVVVRDHHGEVESFAVVVIMKHHHDSVMTGVVDLIYVDPKLRNTGEAGDLLMIAEAELMEMGVKRVMVASKEWSRFDPTTYNYAPTETLYIKHLGE